MNTDVRNEWVKDVLSKIPVGMHILDVGAGRKQYERYCSHLKYTSQDFCKYDGKGNDIGLQRGKKEATDIDFVCDITKIPIADEQFDIILCTEVFEHIPEPIKAIKEFSRLLKSGGHLILTAPFCSLTHYAPYHFYSGFNKYFYDKFLPENGFEILELKANGSFFEYLQQELIRIEKIAIKYTDTQLSFDEKAFIGTLVRWLRGICKRDKNSHELLCFGYNVLAKKL